MAKTLKKTQYFSQEFQKQLEKKRKKKNQMLFLGLIGIAILFYAIAVHRMFLPL